MYRLFVLSFGILAYLSFLAVFSYFAAFMLPVEALPWTIDSPVRVDPLTAVAINVLLYLVFGLQHTVMARPTFKRWWVRIIPREIERSSYVLLSNLLVCLIIFFWQPIAGTVWSVENTGIQYLLYAIFVGGALLAVVSTFQIDHFDLFGVKQVFAYLRGVEYRSPEFKLPFLYKIVRHPLYVGWITMFFVTPHMSVGHLFFAILNTSYILVALFFEERNLVERFGEKYTEYQKQVPMLVPGSKKACSEPMTPAST